MGKASNIPFCATAVKGLIILKAILIEQDTFILA